MRLAIIFSLLTLTLLTMPLCCYEISPHFLTLNLAFIIDAAGRYAGMRLPLIFFTLYFAFINDAAGRIHFAVMDPFHHQ